MPTPTIDLLEEMLTLGGECKCESRHDLNGDECSIKVTHMLKCCVRVNGLRCATATNRIQKKIDSRNYRCGECGRKLHECWTVIPV